MPRKERQLAKTVRETEKKEKEKNDKIAAQQNAFWAETDPKILEKQKKAEEAKVYER